MGKNFVKNKASPPKNSIFFNTIPKEILNFYNLPLEKPGEVQILNAIAHCIFRGEWFWEKKHITSVLRFHEYFSHQRRGLGAGTNIERLSLNDCRTACVSNIRRHRLKEWRTGGSAFKLGRQVRWAFWNLARKNDLTIIHIPLVNGKQPSLVLWHSGWESLGKVGVG